MQDLYEILSVKRSATKKQIRKAYFEIAKKHHPDKNQGRPSEEFARAAFAYKVLSDTKRRKQYNKTGEVHEFDAKTLAVRVAAELFFETINSSHINIKKSNIFNAMKNAIHNKKIKLQDEVKKHKALINRYKEAKKRISGKDDFFIELVKNNVRVIEESLVKLNRDILIYEKTEELLNDYKYANDSSVEVSIMSTTATSVY